MVNIKGNLFDTDTDVICVTTNGYVKSNGECVMGRGCAKELSDMAPEVPSLLGAAIRRNGNVVNFIMSEDGIDIWSFPVKHQYVINDGTNVVRHMKGKYELGDKVMGWASVADMELVERSARQLLVVANFTKKKRILLPRPGCGAGELEWSDVEPILQKILDDRFYCITY